ncbi:phosphate transport system regulatory protein PhoU [candidate division WOR-1 bacterium RIFOXYB2_FULL_48_7]|uniref:Phosphate-specific transport system accessory protein PhoU n=1 Tax=candidate division WOR-1 bacterium RIFOXYB2_FULL_48_7 TaxID=1802583 RepID=A0A1F4T9T1_UNCSA|nr:MAG: phosphate transport system regulatory protein PhoU [candidate division WOR-1 bacterium RIFOXYB2_FULL_48_7]
MIESREHFQKELAKLNDLILKMGGMIEANIAKSIKAIAQADVRMAQEIIRSDDEADQLELEIDDLCLELLATQQPMAIDLRFITTGMRIGTDLERIGDLSVDIAERAIELAKQPLLKPLIDTPKMAELAQQMVHKALDAFVKRDAYLARSLWEDEAKVDKYRDLITEELEDIMRKDASTVTRALPLMLIARYLERIGDHATNIAEDVVYMVEGKVIKHNPKS